MPKLADVNDAAEVDDVERALLKPTGELDVLHPLAPNFVFPHSHPPTETDA
jgi:hypothetical protein